MSTNEEFSSSAQAKALLDLLASDFGQSSPDIALEAIRVELDAAYQRGLEHARLPAARNAPNDACSWIADSSTHETHSYPVEITYNVVAYDSGWNGYGINKSREGFKSEAEALAYVQKLDDHLRQSAVIMKQEKPVVPPTHNARVWPKQEKVAGPHTCHWCKARFSVAGDALAHEDSCSQNPSVKTAD